jgi:hypothetical protein
MFLSRFLLIAPLGTRAGDDGWSVTETEAAFARRLTIDGRAVPRWFVDGFSCLRKRKKREVILAALKDRSLAHYKVRAYEVTMKQNEAQGIHFRIPCAICIAKQDAHHRSCCTYT